MVGGQGAVRLQELKTLYKQPNEPYHGISCTPLLECLAAWLTKGGQAKDEGIFARILKFRKTPTRTF